MRGRRTTGSFPTPRGGSRRRRRPCCPVNLDRPTQEPPMQTTTRDSNGSQFGMIDLGHIDELARRLGSLVPPGLKEGRDELQQNFKSVLQSGLGRLALVTREELDVPRSVLLRRRDRESGVEGTSGAVRGDR